MPPWQEPAWRAEAEAWLRGEVERLGLGPVRSVEQPHVQPWGTVLRAETAGGVLWLKATAPELRHEVAVTELLARHTPELVPSLLAADAGLGWLLSADAGERLRELTQREGSLRRWTSVLPLYAELQLATAGDVDVLLRSGVPDLRLERLPQRFARLLDAVPGPTAEEQRALRALVPRIAELAEELGTLGVPETLQHDDLHDAQVYVRDGRYAVLDWGDACVSHPFFTLSVTLQGVIAWGLDDVEDSVDVTPYRNAYLEPFQRALPDVDVVRACELALPLGWACRAANGHVPGQPEATHARLRMLLNGMARLDGASDLQSTREA